jgi:preprotein translocase subunit YajC
MKKYVKTGLILAAVVAVLVLLSGCLPASTTPASGTSGSSSSGWDSTWPMLAFLAVIFVFFWFVMIRPQRKRQKEHQNMMEGLNKGDRVITAGGIYGTIDSIAEDSVVLKMEGGQTIRVARNSVAVVREK